MKWIRNIWQKTKSLFPLGLQTDQLKKENQTLWKQLNKLKSELSVARFENNYIHGNLESFYKNLFQLSVDAIIFHGLDGVVLAVNPRVYDLTGLLPEEIVGRNISIFNINNNGFSVNDFLNAATIQGNFRCNAEIKNKNGDLLDVEIKSTVLDLPTPLVITYLRDISAYKRANRELLASKTMYFSLLNAITDSIILINNKGKMITANKVVYSFFKKDTQSGNLNFYSFLNNDLVAKLSDVLSDIEINNEMKKFKFEDSGKIYQFQVYPVADKTKEQTLFAIIIKDITVIEENNQKMNLLAQAVEQSANSIVITSLDGSIEYVNQGFTQASGYTMEEARGKNPRILKSGIQNAEVYQELWNKIKEGETWKGEFCNRHKDGHLYWETVMVTPIKNEKGQTIHYLSIKKDISLQKKYESELEKQKSDLLDSEKKMKELNNTKDKFFSIISHDLKSPFNTLLGFSNLLYDSYNTLPDDKRLEYISYLKTASEQGYTLVTNLLDWARTQTGKMEVKHEIIVVSEIIGSVSELVKHAAIAKNISLETHSNPEMNVWADKDMFTTVLRNLATNAIKYTYPGGKIQMSAQDTENEIVISIADNGKGMPPDALAKLFKIEETISTPGTAKEKGTGLGLILCKEFIEKNNGKIWVESEPEKGSTFHFTLPKPKTTYN